MQARPLHLTLPPRPVAAFNRSIAEDCNIGLASTKGEFHTAPKTGPVYCRDHLDYFRHSGALTHNNRTEILSFDIFLDQISLDKIGNTTHLYWDADKMLQNPFFSAFKQTFSPSSPSYIVRDLTIQWGHQNC